MTRLYYLVVAKGAVPPTPSQIVQGASYGTVTVIASGYVDYTSVGVYAADSYPVSGAVSGTTYDQWWVAFDGVEYGFPVKGEVTASGAVLIPTLSLAQVINIMANSVTPQVTLTF